MNQPYGGMDDGSVRKAWKVNVISGEVKRFIRYLGFRYFKHEVLAWLLHLNDEALDPNEIAVGRKGILTTLLTPAGP